MASSSHRLDAFIARHKAKKLLKEAEEQQALGREILATFEQVRAEEGIADTAEPQPKRIAFSVSRGRMRDYSNG